MRGLNFMSPPIAVALPASAGVCILADRSVRHALMLFLGRAAPPLDLRSAVCAGLLFALALLACLGLIEFKARRAGVGILVSVVLDRMLASGFAWVLLA